MSSSPLGRHAATPISHSHSSTSKRIELVNHKVGQMKRPAAVAPPQPKESLINDQIELESDRGKLWDLAPEELEKLQPETLEERHAREAEEAKHWEWPSDWPPEHGEIDRSVQDLPHESADTEWWYVNGHLTAADGKQYSYFVSFFRMFQRFNKEGGRDRTYALTWAIVDPEEKQYYADPVIDPRGPWLLREKLMRNDYKLDELTMRAFFEICDQGLIPGHDRLCDGPVSCATDRLDIRMGHQRFWKDDEGNYRVHCENKEMGIELDLTLKPKKKVVRQGNNGKVKLGLKADTMFYYFIPRCEATGHIIVNHKQKDVTGTGWFDHEFGGACKSTKQILYERRRQAHLEQYAWDWLSMQLDNGYDVTATIVENKATHEMYDKFTVLVAPDSERKEISGDKLEWVGSRPWKSVRTSFTYNTYWTFKVPSEEIDLTIEAVFPDQQFCSLLSQPGFWEGRLKIEGIFHGKKVTGHGFIESHAHQIFDDLKFFFKRISSITRDQIAEIVPLDPDYEQARMLICDKSFDHVMKDVNLELFADRVIKPVRTIVDRGGKAWRSYAVLVCLDAVGGNSEPYRHLLMMPELMHVGSLIVDDIQDESEERRGGPTAHKMFGTACAINAGTASYFTSLHTVLELTWWMSDEMRLYVYNLFMLTLSAGHSGQGFDIKGLGYMMPETVASGDGTKLADAIKCTHLLKSGVPAGCLARIGAAMGGGTEQQIEALGIYFERVGVAFQIIDDVLNLRGLPGKTRGEDLMAGKVTFPIALAMSRIPSLEERQELWDFVQSKCQDQDKVDACVAKLEACGALKASEDYANQIVEEAWASLNPLLEASFYKMMIRAFGFFVLQRHY